MTRTAGRQDASLLAPAAPGDEIAFRRIIAAHHEDMRRVAAYVAGDHAIAEEATQAAWVIAWKKLGNVTSEFEGLVYYAHAAGHYSEGALTGVIYEGDPPPVAPK